MNRLAGKVVVMAGGAGGLGSATARRLVSEGAAVAIGDVNFAGARDLAREIVDAGGKAFAAELDLACEEQVKSLIAQTIKDFGRLDGVHANGAYLVDQHKDTDILDLDFDYWDRAMDVNLKGYAYVTRHALPHMLKAGAGSFVYMSSVAAFFGEGERVAYAVSKAGVNALARHVATRWGKMGIRSNVIAPGPIQTPPVLGLPQEFRDQLLEGVRTTRLGLPFDIAAMVAMLLSDDAAFIQGQVYSVDGGSLMR